MEATNSDNVTTAQNLLAEAGEEYRDNIQRHNSARHGHSDGKNDSRYSVFD